MRATTRFSRSTLLRCVREGHEAYRMGLGAKSNPYGTDERNGAWSFGYRQARERAPLTRATHNFKRQEAWDVSA